MDHSPTPKHSAHMTPEMSDKLAAVYARDYLRMQGAMVDAERALCELQGFCAHLCASLPYVPEASDSVAEDLRCARYAHRMAHFVPRGVSAV